MNRKTNDTEQWSRLDLVLLTAARAAALIVAPAVVWVLEGWLLAGLVFTTQAFWICWYESPLSDSYRENMRRALGID
jgi:hypothetical protein